MDFTKRIFFNQIPIHNILKKKYWDALDKAEMVAEQLCPGEIDYKSGDIFYGLSLTPKIKYCVKIDNYGILQEHKTFKGSTTVKGF